MPSLEAIVVDTEATGREAIKELSDGQLGVATFLPLDSIRIKDVKEKFRNQQQFPGVHLAVDLVNPTAPAYLRAVQYACGDTIVCDSMSVARDVCYRQNEQVKAVTLEGEVFHKDGKLTGGGSEQSDRSARQWQQRDFDTLQERQNDNLKELEAKQTALRRLPDEADTESAIKGLEVQLKTMRQSQSTEKSKVDDVEKRLKEDEGKLRQINIDLEKVNTAV